MTIIRAERPEDVAAIQVINERAFGRREEGEIVDRLRENCPTSSPWWPRTAEWWAPSSSPRPCSRAPGAGSTGCSWRTGGAAGAPAAGHRLGAGASGLEILRERGCPFIVLVGHPEYYPRFGFGRASALGLVCPGTACPTRRGWSASSTRRRWPAPPARFASARSGARRCSRVSDRQRAVTWILDLSCAERCTDESASH